MPDPMPSAHIGTFARFSEAWHACLRQVLRHGDVVHDEEKSLKESLNLTVSAWDCERVDLEAAGADPGRLELMIEKYESLSVLPSYSISYGKLFRQHAGVDQVDWLTQRLKLKPETKSATIGFHVPGDEVLSCISLMDGKLRHGRLHVTAVFRSQNIFASQPGNACALRRVQAELADGLGVAAGALTLHIVSAHIYEEDWDAASRIVDPYGAGTGAAGAPPADGRGGHNG